MAKGPAFYINKTIDSFENVNIQSLLCGLLKIKCPQTNGTILTLKEALVDFNFNHKTNNSIRKTIIR